LTLKKPPRYGTTITDEHRSEVKSSIRLIDDEYH
jgi:hypothetical protein